MHAASVILLCWAMIGAACFFSHAMAGVTAGLLAVLVAAVGLPHGAADHRFARSRLEPVLGMAWIPVFLAGYLAIAVVVVCGWFVAPAVTIVTFFLASAWHFGQEEPRLPLGPHSLRPVFRFARGGLVIWTPLLFHSREVAAILGVAAPGGRRARNRLGHQPADGLCLDHAGDRRSGLGAAGSGGQQTHGADAADPARRQRADCVAGRALRRREPAGELPGLFLCLALGSGLEAPSH